MYPQTMASVTDFKQFLSKKVPERQSEHKALYNYLHSFCHKEQKLTADLFTDFYRKALLFPYWQGRFDFLQQTVKAELASFNKFYYSAEGSVLHQQAVITHRQLVAVQKQTDRVKIVEFFLQSGISKGDKVCALPWEQERVLGLVLRCDGNLDVFSFGPLSLLVRGKLEPLSPLSELYYSPQYELRPGYKHIIEDFNLNFTHFTIKEDIATGRHSRDFCFQPSELFKKNIKDMDNLFCLLKKTESLFIQPKSDPHYKQLIHCLHDHYRRVLLSPDLLDKHFMDTQKVLSSAKKALKHIYPKDRLLFLLTANIDFHLRKRRPVAQSVLSSAESEPHSHLQSL